MTYLNHNASGNKIFDGMCGIVSWRIKHGQNPYKSEWLIIEFYSNS